MPANPATGSLHHHVDQPLRWSFKSRVINVKGWCFTNGGISLWAIRLRASGFILPGVVGLPRPDVKAALPQAPGANTGFEILGVLPPGRHHAILEAGLTDGSWSKLGEYTVTIRRHWMPGWLRKGSLSELIAIQTPTHGSYAPRLAAAERFPSKPPAGPAPKISVVTPSYNHARFIEETMQSVLQQNVAAEYVVQDGGSGDGSAAIIQRHANRLAAWASRPDDGQADAIARGFAKTAGRPDDVMAWINSDDYYLPGALGFVANFFSPRPDVDVVYGHRLVVDEDSREIARWFLPRHDPEILRLNDFVPQETLFWRRRMWDKVGGLDTSFKFAMDWDLLLRFQAAGAKIVRVPYFLGCFRVHPAQKTAAAMHSVGQHEIDLLRTRANGRPISSAELENNPPLLRYLRRSAFIEFLWKLGLRAP
jgi:glycosyltransferase involved in cell wall biosynthesis